MNFGVKIQIAPTYAIGIIQIFICYAFRRENSNHYAISTYFSFFAALARKFILLRSWSSFRSVIDCFQSCFVCNYKMHSSYNYFIKEIDLKKIWFIGYRSRDLVIMSKMSIYLSYHDTHTSNVRKVLFIVLEKECEQE